MHVPTDSHLTQGDTGQDTQTETFTADHEHEACNTALGEDSVPDDLNSPSNVHLSLVKHSGDLEVNEGQGPIHPLKFDQEPSHIQTLRNWVDHEHDCIHPQSCSDQIIVIAFSKEIPSSGCAVVPTGGPIPFKNADSEENIIICPQEPPLLRSRTVSSTTIAREDRDVNLDYRLTCTRPLHTEPANLHGVGPALLTDGREDFDYSCVDLPSSLPPSSSLPQLFSSSPIASSQSSLSEVKPSKMVSSVVAEGCTNSQDCPYEDQLVSVAQGKSRLESKNLHNHDITNVATTSAIDKRSLLVDPTLCIEGSLGPSTKQIAFQSDPGEPCESQPIKRPKLDLCPYPPPTPKRATLTSQHRQFKKLAAPFRPPFRLPVVTDGRAQAMNTKETESNINSTPETSRDRVDPKRHINCLLPSQHKAANTSKSANQFKSPLINRDLPADSRAIRLTPALQVLERKLQLLKRAIKIKEDEDEEVLTRLTGKWIEAGREVAYEVWDATKDAGTFGEKSAFIRRSFGRESTNSGNTLWGWDIRPEDAGEESCNFDLSPAPCDEGRSSPAKDNDVGCSTVGTMLRQLGIASEMFGWDDDRETFVD